MTTALQNYEKLVAVKADAFDYFEFLLSKSHFEVKMNTYLCCLPEARSKAEIARFTAKRRRSDNVTNTVKALCESPFKLLKERPSREVKEWGRFLSNISLLRPLLDYETEQQFLSLGGGNIKRQGGFLSKRWDEKKIANLCFSMLSNSTGRRIAFASIEPVKEEQVKKYSPHLADKLRGLHLQLHKKEYFLNAISLQLGVCSGSLIFEPLKKLIDYNALFDYKDSVFEVQVPKAQRKEVGRKTKKWLFDYYVLLLERTISGRIDKAIETKEISRELKVLKDIRRKGELRTFLLNSYRQDIEELIDAVLSILRIFRQHRKPDCQSLGWLDCL